MCCDPRLHQTIHSLLDYDIDVSVEFLVEWVIFVDDLSGDYLESYTEIFCFLHWIVQMEVLEIYNEIFPIWCGNDAVTIEFGCCQI